MHREIVLVVVGVRVKAALATRPGAKVLLPALAAVQRARGGRHRVAAFVVQDVGQAVLVRRGGGHGAVRVVGETEGGMGAKGVWDPADSIKEDFGHRRRRSAVVGDAGRRRCGCARRKIRRRGKNLKFARSTAIPPRRLKADK